MSNIAVLCNYVEGETFKEFKKGEKNKKRYEKKGEYIWENHMGIYIHSSRGEDVIRALLMYCKFKGYRATNEDGYGWSRLCQVICNYEGGALGIGIGNYYQWGYSLGKFLAEGDGIYLIKDWEIKGKYFDDEWVNRDIEESRMCELIKKINACQPVAEQMTEEEIEEKVNIEYSPCF